MNHNDQPFHSAQDVYAAYGAGTAATPAAAVFTPKAYRQTAQGSFTAHVMPGTPHCGVTDNRVAVEYDIAITYRPGALDDNGFLLDNTWFRAYFEAFEHARLSISCERFAELIATDLSRALADRLHEVAVRLSAVPGVWVEVAGSPAPAAN